jgi:hypothetical protein
MAVESKPLFHPEVIRQQVAAFTFPAAAEAAQAKLQHWAELIASGKADAINEKALLPDFLTDVFLNLLGYTVPAGSSGAYRVGPEWRQAGVFFGRVRRGGICANVRGLRSVR